MVQGRRSSWISGGSRALIQGSRIQGDMRRTRDRRGRSGTQKNTLTDYFIRYTSSIAF